MTATRHSSSVIDPKARVHESVEVGPFCFIGPNVKIGADCVLKSHVVIEGLVSIGEKNTFYTGNSIGAPPQDTGYKDEESRVEIGDRNIFREHVTIHRGTSKQDLLTKIGNDCFFMVNAHVGHDCLINDKVILVNNVALAGHCEIGEGSVLGGGSCLQQFGKIGRGCFIGGVAAIDKDIPSYSTAYGNRVFWKGLNLIGLKRRGFERKFISQSMAFFDGLKDKNKSFSAMMEDKDFMITFLGNPIVEQIVLDIKRSKLGIAAIKNG